SPPPPPPLRGRLRFADVLSQPVGHRLRRRSGGGTAATTTDDCQGHEPDPGEALHLGGQFSELRRSNARIASGGSSGASKKRRLTHSWAGPSPSLACSTENWQCGSGSPVILIP